MSDMDLTTSVEYRQIDDVEGYRFGSDGSAQSCWEGHGPASHKTDRWHDLAINPIRGRKYLMVCVRRNGKRFKTALHPLVCEAFRGKKPPGHECRHLNDDPLDNRIDNLVWGTRRQNAYDRHRNGIQSLGEQCYQSKLTTDDVMDIRRRYGEGGVTLEQLADEYGVVFQTIFDVVSYRSWKHVI